MNIFAEVKKLNFPIGKYIIVGSGIMAALGLKEANDIDLVVAPDIFQKCIDGSWEKVDWTLPDHRGQFYLRRGLVELYLDVNCGNFNPTLEELLSRVVTIDGISFISLEDCLKFKKEYGREKHLKDVKTIEDYLAKH